MSDQDQEWQAPPMSKAPQEVGDSPKMSAFQTLIDIFHAPGEVFEDLRKKPFPRLIFPVVLCAILLSGYTFLLNQKLGPERIMAEQLATKWMEQLPEDAKQKMMEDAKNASVVRTAITSSIGGIVFIVIFVIWGLIYWGGGLAFGGEGNFWHGLAVAAYSTFPPLLISMVASYLILLLKYPDEISFLQSQSGLMKSNPGLFLDISPVINAIFSRIDLLVIWGMFLAVIGLRKCLKISAGSGWTISLILWLIGTTLAVVGAMFAG